MPTKRKKPDETTKPRKKQAVKDKATENVVVRKRRIASPAGRAVKRAKKEVAVAAAAEKVEQVVEYRAGQVIRHAAKAAIVTQWFQLIEGAIVTLCNISKLATTLEAVFLSLFAAPIPVVMADGFEMPPAPPDMFGKPFFEHLFKACTWDSCVKFEPTLQFVRCMWFHALLVRNGEFQDARLDLNVLWTDVQSDHVASQARKVKNKQKSDAIKKKKQSVAAVEPEEEEEEETNEKGDIDVAAAFDRTSLVTTIIRHPLLKKLLPSCVGLDQCIKYKSNSYRVAFQQHQVTGFRAHLVRYLNHKYRIGTKKTLDSWIDENLKLVKVADDDESAADQTLVTEHALLDADAEEEEEDEDDTQADFSQHTRLEWNATNQATEAARLHHLATTKSNSFLAIVRLHLELLHELEQCHVQAQAQAHEPAVVLPKLFAIAPQAGYRRNFMRFDLAALRKLAPKLKLERLEDIFDHKLIGIKRKRQNGKSLDATFVCDGVQVHLMWVKRISVACMLDPATIVKMTKAQVDREVKIAAEQQAALQEGRKVDTRVTRDREPPLLPMSKNGVFRRKTDSLLDFEHGIFQSASIGVTRQIMIDRIVDTRSPSLDDLVRMPFNLTAIDPGILNPICAATFDKETGTWKRGVNLTNRAYYNRLGHKTMQRRMQRRLVAAAESEATIEPDRMSVGRMRALDSAARVVHHQKELSIRSIKSANSVSCLESLVTTTLAWSDVFEFYGSRNVTRVRMTTAANKQRLVADLIERLAPSRKKGDRPNGSDTIIVLGSARFATTSRGSQATPIGYLIRELSKVRRIVLVDEYFTSQMCSYCNLSGVGSSCSDHMTSKHEVETDPLCSRYPLRDKCGISRRISKTTMKNHLSHPTCRMASFVRTHVPKGEARCAARKQARRLARLPPLPPPPLPDGPELLSRNKSQFRVIHGLKQCLHCSSYVSRDYNAARNIGWVFIGLLVCGLRPIHLRRPDVKLSDSSN